MFLGIVAFLIMGLVLGLIGGGGSVLTVPILVYIFKQTPLLATENSLFIVGMAAAVGGIQSLHKKQVCLKTTILFSIPGFVGVYLSRTLILKNIPDVVTVFSPFVFLKSTLVMLSFAAVMLVASYKMIRPSAQTLESGLQGFTPVRMAQVALYGLLVGAVAGFVGAGGGFLIIPALIFLLGLPMKKAIGTSLLIIAIQSILGFISSSNLSHASWLFLLQASAVATIGLLIGNAFSKRVPEKKLKLGFGYFVLLVAMFITVEQGIRFL